MKIRRQRRPDFIAVVATGVTLALAITLWLRADAAPPKPPSARIFVVLKNTVGSLAWSPDGKQLASTSWDKSVRVWNVATGKADRVLLSPHTEVDDVAYSPDGRRIAAGSDGETLVAWNAATGARIGPRPSRPHEYSATTVVFSPNGRFLASAGSEDRTVKLWDARTLRVTRVLTGGSDWGAPLAISPDGEKLAVVRQNTVTVWDTATGNILYRLNNFVSSIYWSGVSWLTFSPDGKTLVCDRDGFASVHDAATGAPRSRFSHTSISFASFSKNGRVFATTDALDVQLRDVRTGALRETLTRLPRSWPSPLPRRSRHQSPYPEWITAMQISPDGKTIAYATMTKIKDDSNFDGVKDGEVKIMLIAVP